MAAEAREILIRTGDQLAVSEAGQIYGLPVEFVGFENLSLARVDLSDTGDVKTLIPDFDYRPSEYQAEEAICFSEAGQPVIAIVKGHLFRNRWVPVISIANLSVEPEKVILVGPETWPLENNDFFWPGYALTEHQKNMKLGLETMLVDKHGEEFVISFPEGDAV